MRLPIGGGQSTGNSAYCWSDRDHDDPKAVDAWGVPYGCWSKPETDVGLCVKHYREIVGCYADALEDWVKLGYGSEDAVDTGWATVAAGLAVANESAATDGEAVELAATAV